MGVDRYRVRHKDDEALKRIDPSETGHYKDKASAIEKLEAGLQKLDALQERLYANDRYALLLIFQGMDAAGKDSAIKHVLSGLNPQGTEVRAFKVPSSEELAHDFLWRAAKALPSRGRIGIFNRSYYEDVIVVRVHPEFIGARRLPEKLVTKDLWAERYEDIAAFERHLVRSGTVIRKFFLHVSREKQSKRLMARLDDPAKHWKFSLGDLVERDQWKKYREAWTDAVAATSHAHAPWFVVPADHKWYAHLVIAEVILEALQELDLSIPAPTPSQERDLAKARKILKRS